MLSNLIDLCSSSQPPQLLQLRLEHWASLQIVISSAASCHMHSLPRRQSYTGSGRTIRLRRNIGVTASARAYASWFQMDLWHSRFRTHSALEHRCWNAVLCGLSQHGQAVDVGNWWYPPQRN